MEGYQAGTYLSASLSSPSPAQGLRSPDMLGRDPQYQLDDSYPDFRMPTSPSIDQQDPDSEMSAMTNGPPQEENNSRLSPQLVDAILKNFNLDLNRSKQAKLVMNMAADATDAGRMLLWLTIGAQLGSIEQRLEAFEKKSIEDVNSLSSVLADIKVFLKKFELSKDQKSNIRLYCQQMVYGSTRTKFHRLASDVRDHIEEKAQELGFANIFPHKKEPEPHRIDTLERAIRNAASSARNQYRMAIVASVGDADYKTLQQFTDMCNDKYLKGLSVKTKDDEIQRFLYKNALLRRFTVEHHNIQWADENDTEDVTVPVERDNGNKRKRGEGKAAGRVARGEDYWGKVDEWFRKLVKEYGPDLTDAKWKDHINRVIQMDNARFTGTQMEWDMQQQRRAPTSQAASTQVPLRPITNTHSLGVDGRRGTGLGTGGSQAGTQTGVDQIQALMRARAGN